MKKTILTTLSVLLSYSRDIFRFIKHSHLFSANKNKLTSQAHMYRLAHALEKGMALPKPRKGFGKSKMEELIKFISEYCIKYGADNSTAIASSSIKSLIEFHKRDGIDIKATEKLFLELCVNHSDLLTSHQMIQAGTRGLSKKNIIASLPVSPESFFGLRCSVRKYAKKKITKEEIIRILNLANKTPSVCNRQSARVYIYDNEISIKNVLKHQDGNSGFGSDASAVFIITSDLSCFYKAGERNQGYVDGGLYAMSLVYAIHSIGLGSCMLNWSQGARTDQRLRDDTRIPSNEVIITMIAIGNLQENFDVAVSPRRPINQIASFE